MKSERLTEGYRTRIRQAALHKAFSEREAELARGADRLARQVIEDCLERHAFPSSLWFSLPRELVGHGEHVLISLEGEKHWLNLSSPLPIPHECASRYDVETATRLALGVSAYRKASSRLTADRKQLSGWLKSLLASVTTTGKLLEIWPEAAEFLDRTANVAPVPCVPMDRLRAYFKPDGKPSAWPQPEEESGGL